MLVFTTITLAFAGITAVGAFPLPDSAIAQGPRILQPASSFPRRNLLELRSLIEHAGNAEQWAGETQHVYANQKKEKRSPMEHERHVDVYDESNHVLSPKVKRSLMEHALVEPATMKRSPMEHAGNAAQWFVDVYNEETGKTEHVYVDQNKEKRSPMEHTGNAAQWFVDVYNEETGKTEHVYVDQKKEKRSPMEHAGNAAQWFVDVYNEETGKTEHVYVDQNKEKRSPMEHAGNAAQWFVDVYNEETGKTEHVYVDPDDLNLDKETKRSPTKQVLSDRHETSRSGPESQDQN